MTRPSIEALAASLALDLSAAQAAQLQGFLDLLARWNGTFNLTAVRDRDAMVIQHLADCMSIVPALVRHRPQGQGRLLDVGSGGGLPGVVVAVCRPDWQVECLDAVGKKAAFVRQVAAELRLPNLVARHERLHATTVARQHAEGRSVPAAGADVVTSRAFASLAGFVQLTRAERAPAGVWMAMKGRVPTDEIDALPADVGVFHVEPIAVPGLAAARCLVWMRPKAL